MNNTKNEITYKQITFIRDYTNFDNNIIKEAYYECNVGLIKLVDDLIEEVTSKFYSINHVDFNFKLVSKVISEDNCATMIFKAEGLEIYQITNIYKLFYKDVCGGNQ